MPTSTAVDINHSQRPDRRVPPHALVLVGACLLIPLATAGFMPEWSQQQEMLIWLPALVPAFLLTYYRGWNGASLALAAGMVTLALVQVEVFVLRLSPPHWSVVFGVVLLLVTVALGSGWVGELLHREREAAERSALTDPLTDLPNRRYATVFLEAAWAAAHRGRALSVVLFDIDGFKAVNDTLGHSEGDRVLCGLASTLRARTRSMDLSARFGGEEFLTILSDCGIEEAVRFAEAVRISVAEQRTPDRRITVSAGVASFEAGMGSPDVLLAAADRALYAAKEIGRNRVMRAGEREVRVDHAVATPPRPPRRLEDVEILVVDDDAASLEATARVLERLGCRVSARLDAREAVTAVRQGAVAPDLVVTDIIMPEMSGFTLVDLLSRLRPGLPALYISGYPQEEVYWGGTPGARSSFLAKPFLVEEVDREIRGLLGVEPIPEPPALEAADGNRNMVGAPAEDATRGNGSEGGRILIADDDPGVLRSLVRVLEHAGYARPFTTTDPRAIDGLLTSIEPDLVLLDLHMPHVSGFDVLERLRARRSEADFLPVLVLTGEQDDSARRQALELGASDFLTKPVEIAEVLTRVRNLLRTRLLHRRLVEHTEELERTVASRTSELADTRTEILHRLARAAEYRDDISGRHAGRVGLLSALLATELGISMEDRELIRKTAPLHDVGKIAVPDSILKKRGSLTSEEFEVMKTHTTVGAKILEGSAHGILRMAASIAEHHHERWDGGGYPHGLQGEAIPLEARIVAVADTFDVLTHRRPYKPPISPLEALAELKRCRLTHFDPAIVDALLATAERVGAEALPALVDPADPWKDIAL